MDGMSGTALRHQSNASVYERTKNRFVFFVAFVPFGQLLFPVSNCEFDIPHSQMEIVRCVDFIDRCVHIIRSRRL